MQKKRVVTVVLIVAVAVAAVASYDFFVINSLSGYTKISLTSAQTYSIRFGGTAYNITYFYNYVHDEISSTMPIFQVTAAQTTISNSNESFAATQGTRCSFAGLQMVVGSVNSNRMILYVKPMLRPPLTSSKQTIFPATSSTTQPTSATPPYPTETNVEVAVSGWTVYCQSGNITFKNPCGQYEAPISNRWYTISLMGGQSYNVTITYQGTEGQETQSTTIYIPNYTFSANFPPITAAEGIEKTLT